MGFKRSTPIGIVSHRPITTESAWSAFFASEGPLHTFCALQAVARHVEAGSHRLEGRHRALDWMNQEQGPLLALNTVEWYHCGAVGADQHLGWIRIGQRINSVSLCCRAVQLWKVGHTYTPRSSSVSIHTSCCISQLLHVY